MADKKPSDQYSDKEAKERAEQAMRGAFKTPPMHEKKEAREPKPPRKKQ